MKKKITYLVLLLYSLNLFGQYEEIVGPQGYVQTKAIKPDSIVYFYTVNLDTFSNIIPVTNEITGIIAQFKTSFYSGKQGIKSTTKKEFTGEYLNGRKIGRWESQKRNGSVVSTEIIEYKKDTVKFNPAFPFGREYLYIGDSSLIYGRINTWEYQEVYSGLVISFRCIKESGCVFKTPNNKIITESNFDDLESTIYELELGMYNRKIRELIE